MSVEHLSLICFPFGDMGIASPIASVVCDQDELIHVIVQRLRHLIEGADIEVQRWDREYIRPIAKIACQP